MRNILECMVIVMEMLITIILQFVQLNNKSKVDVYILDKNNNDDGLSQERLWLISRKVYIQSPWQFVHPNSQTQFLVRWKNFPDIWLSIYNLLVKAEIQTNQLFYENLFAHVMRWHDCCKRFNFNIVLSGKDKNIIIWLWIVS